MEGVTPPPNWVGQMINNIFILVSELLFELELVFESAFALAFQLVLRSIFWLVGQLTNNIYMVQYATFQDFCLWVGPNRF